MRSRVLPFSLLFALASCNAKAVAPPSPPPPEPHLANASAHVAEAPPSDPVEAAQAYRTHGDAVSSSSDRMVIAEGEEFNVDANSKDGWRARPWGTNYAAATMSNAFLSRQAYLGAPEQCARSSAAIVVRVPADGRYAALVRYEAAYRFETQFRLQIRQKNRLILDHMYGARKNLKIWAFGKKLQTELAWPWGASESFVWEGHDAYADLEAGDAEITILADAQPEPAARRNVDLVMLTRDLDDVKKRIEHEGYLPLDGLLTQQDDVYLRVKNEGAPFAMKIDHGTEHSPYWVHQRAWKPKTFAIGSNDATEWLEVGSLLDSLNDGQWTLEARANEKNSRLHYALTIGARNANGSIDPIRTFDGVTGDLALAYFGNTRYSRKIRRADEVLYDLLATLEAHDVRGRAPTATTILDYTFDRVPNDARYDEAIDTFTRLLGTNAHLPMDPEAIDVNARPRRGAIDTRHLATDKLDAFGAKLEAAGKADAIAIVSDGDEIGLAEPPQDDAKFRAWLRERGVHTLGDAAQFDANEATSHAHPELFYYSKLYAYRYGAAQEKARTEILKRHFRNAEIGANFSPHHGAMYLGETHQWISLFRDHALTMPWGEDYTFQVPVASPQVNELAIDIFRAGIAKDPSAKIVYYVMAHWPGNTTSDWRRAFYGDIAHGVKIFDLYELRPVQAAYTENHVDAPAMYETIRTALHELGTFEDVVQAAHPRRATTALWFSEAADVWSDHRAPFDAHERALYLAIRHAGAALDVVVDGDDLASYRVLYLTDAHVTRAGAKQIATWVRRGGHLIATAEAGMLDEFDGPNRTMHALFGIDETATPELDPALHFEKQDLPFAPALDHVHTADGTIPAYGAVSYITIKNRNATARATFDDTLHPAIVERREGIGRATYLAFLPALSYLKPAIPQRPFDRVSRDDAMAHLLPSTFDAIAARVITPDASDLPVTVSAPLVEATLLESDRVVVVPLIRWEQARAPLRGLEVTLHVPVPTTHVELASGGAVTMKKSGGDVTFVLDLDVADALILR